jgi:hypothetical protein
MVGVSSAVNTDNFTAPTAAFSSDTDTVVLYHLDNALTDSSSNAYTLNTSGGYSSSVVKFGTYSGNLSDSTSDYFAHTTDRYFAPYNGTIRTNLTWECWAYYTSWSGASFNHASQNNPHPTLMCAGDQAGNRQSLKFGFSGSEGPYAEGLLCATAGDNTNGNIDTFTIKGTTSFSLNTWYHVALTFNASTGAVKGYVDGVLQFSGTKTDLGYTLGTHLTLGAMQSNNSACYVDEVRISRKLRYGTGAVFTVPTAEFTSDANTKLLLHFNGTNGATTTTDDNIDRTAKTVTAVGNAQVDTAQSKFGGASALFDGTGDGLTVSAGGFNVGAGDITIEFWVRHAAINDQQVYCDFRTSSNNHFIFYMKSDNKLELYDGGSTYTSVVTMAANTWYHLAISRSGSSLKVYRDGTEVMSATNSRNLSDNSTIVVGSSIDPTVNTTNSMNGHMDEIRISNTARYTTGFTPSASAFTNDADTLLLLHCNGTDASTTFTDDNTTRTAKAVTLTTSSLNTTTKKFGTASLSVDGTGGDRATIPDTGDVDLQAAPRTFECWVYINSFTNASRNSPDHLPKLMGHMDQGGNIYWTFGPNTEQGISFYYWSGGNNWVHSTKKDLVTGQWYHMALIITATGAKGYVDGVEYVSSALSNTPTAGNTIFSIGSEFGQSMNAYIDEVRISHVNRYT